MGILLLGQSRWKFVVEMSEGYDLQVWHVELWIWLSGVVFREYIIRNVSPLHIVKG